MVKTKRKKFSYLNDFTNHGDAVYRNIRLRRKHLANYRGESLQTNASVVAKTICTGKDKRGKTSIDPIGTETCPEPIHDLQVSSDINNAPINQNLPDKQMESDITFESCSQSQSEQPISKPSCSSSCSSDSTEATLLLEKFCLRHHLSTCAKDDLHKLLRMIAPDKCSMWNQSISIETLIREKVSVNYTFFCRKCHNVLHNGKFCEDCEVDDFKPNAFATISIDDQLNLKFQDAEFYKLIQDKLARQSSKDTISDVYDGQRYKNLEACGYFSSGHNLTFQMCVDGCPIFKSSNTSAWPILLKINELPPEHRQKRKNILMAGIWIGERKPEFAEILSPLVADINEMYEHGVKVTTSSEEFLVRGLILSAHVDLPAKACLLNMNQFNGAYSCSYCLHPAQSVATEKGGNVKVFPFDARDQPPLRTDSSFREDAMSADKEGKTISGIKGFSPLNELQSFDLVEGVCLDYMHQVFLGVTKRLMGKWFNTSNHKELWYCGKQQTTVSARLQQITPPKELTRLPRGISSIKFWKASEYKHFLLFYLVPCMIGILPNIYLQHVVLLSTATYLLSKQTISTTDMAVAGKCLHDFVILMGKLYGPREMTLNVHMLLHATWMVQLNGPLHVISNFDFEDMIGCIKSAPTGTQYVHSQVIRNILLQQVLPVLWDEVEHTTEGEHVYELLNQGRKQHMDSSGTVKLLGAKKKALKKVLKLAAQHLPALPHTNGHIFKRVKKGHVEYTSESYTRNTRRCDNVVTIQANGSTLHGVIQYFYESDNDVYAVMSKLNLQSCAPFDGKVLQSRILWKSVERSRGDTMFIPINSVLVKCILFDQNNEHLVLIELPSSSCFD